MSLFKAGLSRVQAGLARGYILLATLLLASGIAYFLWFVSPGGESPRSGIEFSYAVEASSEPITPIPLEIKLDRARLELGRRLFHDMRLSGDGTLSCASCHDLDRGGAGLEAYSRGVGGRLGEVNVPTVFNSGFNFRQFWDGRAATLEEQVDGPINNPVEMASNWPHVLDQLKKDVDYPRAFAAIYPDGICVDSVKDAIATFERSLYTPNSRFDRFLRGDRTALNEDEQAGYRSFKELGCVSCHQGMNVGGNLYEKMGVMEDYFTVRGNITEADQGRYNLTGIEEQRFEFKVPSLRNVALTAPYFHDGSAATLEDAARMMAKHQLGIELSEHQQRQIAAFLRTLTGEYPGKAAK